MTKNPDNMADQTRGSLIIAAPVTFNVVSVSLARGGET